MTDDDARNDDARNDDAIEPGSERDEVVPDEILRSGKLPPLRYRPLPEPMAPRKMIGPSIILAGLALGSGEFVIWPWLTYESGFVFFWACLLGVTTQYFINMEITRWSLATGESATTGFSRLGRHWGWIFLVCNIVPWLVPAWATGAAQVVGWVIWSPGSEEVTMGGPAVKWMAIGGLFACGAVLTAGKVVYETVERVQLILVSLILILIVVLAFLLVRPDAISAQLAGAFSVGSFPDMEGPAVTWAALLGALAFAGAGGTLNLGQSNFIKDKGYGMGRYIGRITSPITGQQEAISEIGYHFPHDEENLSRWRRWWKAASIEHFVSFFLTCVVSLVLLTLISYSVFHLPGGERIEGAEKFSGNMKFIWGEALAIGRDFGGMVKVLFLLMGATILLTTVFGVLDASSRISADICKTNWLSKSQKWTESRLYYVFLWGTILVATMILLTFEDLGALKQFLFTSALNGGVMFIYSVTLLWLNRYRLSGIVRMSGWRMAIMIWSIVFFGGFGVFAVWDTIRRFLS